MPLAVFVGLYAAYKANDVMNLIGGYAVVPMLALFPEPMRRVEILSIPVLLIILTMCFWLVRIRARKWRPGNGREPRIDRQRSLHSSS